MTALPKPWHRRRRTYAAALLLVLSYPLSFVPACWVMMRTDLESHHFAWGALREVHRPTAFLLKLCPEVIQDAVCRVVDLGAPEDFGLSIRPDLVGFRQDVPDDDPTDSEITFSILIVW